MIETNHTKIEKRLLEKGWDRHYVGKTLHFLKKSENSKHPSIKKLDKSMFLFVTISFALCTAAAFFGLIPVFISLPGMFSSFAVMVFGLSCGMFFDPLLRHVNTTSENYFFSVAFFPLIALAILFLMAETVNSLFRGTGIYFSASPLAVTLIYILSFSMPHILHKTNDAK